MSEKTNSDQRAKAGGSSMWNSPGLAALVGLLTALLGGGGVGAALFVLQGDKPEQTEGAQGEAETDTEQLEAAKQRLLATGACSQVSESSTLLEVAEDCAGELEQMRKDLDSFKKRNADAQRAFEVIHGQ